MEQRDTSNIYNDNDEPAAENLGDVSLFHMLFKDRHEVKPQPFRDDPIEEIDIMMDDPESFSEKYYDVPLRENSDPLDIATFGIRDNFPSLSRRYVQSLDVETTTPSSWSGLSIRNTRSHNFTTTRIVCFLGMAVVILATVLFSRNASTHDSSKEQQEHAIISWPPYDSNQPPSLLLDTLRTKLLPISGNVLFNASSAHYKALEWLVNNGPIPNSSLVEVYVLSLLYFETGGPNRWIKGKWGNQANFMNASVPICDWNALPLHGTSTFRKGAFCDDGNNPHHVSHIKLNLYNMRGTLPPELTHLSYLTAMDINDNHLTGTIPTELGELSNVFHFSVMDNELTGTIPTQLSNIGSNSSRRFTVNLSANRLVGTIPTELSKLPLESLSLSQNSLTGTLPIELCTITTMSLFRLSDNKLTGTIPAELANISDMSALFLNDNQLTGTVPSQLGNFNADRLSKDPSFN